MSANRRKMNRILLAVLSVLFLFFLCSCEKGNAKVDQLLSEIETEISRLDMKKADLLCKNALTLEPTEEQMEKIRSYENVILKSCYPGTFVVQVERVATVSPTAVGENSYFTVSTLGKYDDVFCRYTYAKDSEKEMAAQQYKAYLDERYTFLNVKVETAYTTYCYADESGNSLKLQVFNENYSNADMVMHLDCNLFNTNRIDLSRGMASLCDTSIVITE